MRRIAITLVALTTMAILNDVAAAADGCGRGRFWNGYRCAPMEMRYYGPRPDYGPPPGYYDHEGGNRRGPDCYNYHGRRICCPRRWTVQDGVCKPYTGR